MRLRKRATPTPDDGSVRTGRPGRIGRPGVVRKLLNLYPEARYLEVGVSAAATFDKVSAPRKVAVDPAFRFDHTATERQVEGTEYHKVTSDEYFDAVAPDEQFDVIFLDGLHVFEQTLRDLINALEHLQPRGVIVIDDTRPPTHLASLRDLDQFVEVRSWLGSNDNRWMGDVFKLVWFIDSFCPHLTYRTIANNHGQTVVWRKARPLGDDRRMEDISRMGFEQMVSEEQVLRLRPFPEILEELTSDLGVG